MRYFRYVPIEVEVSDTTTSVTLTTPDHQILKLPTFTKADGQRFVRFTGNEVGEYTINQDSQSATFELSEYHGSNPLFLHGPITLSANGRHLVHMDSHPFLWLADTWWFGLTDRAPWTSVFKKLVATRKQQHFSVVLMVVGIPPEVSVSSTQAVSQGHLPWTSDLLPNAAYFDAIDQKILHAIENGIVPCLVGGWGPQIQHFGVKAFTDFWREVIARYASWPVVWCLTGEVDLMSLPSRDEDPVKTSLNQSIKSFLPPKLKQLMRQVVQPFRNMAHASNVKSQVTTWQAVAEWITANDPFHRLLTVHPHTQATAAKLFTSPTWLSINTIQSGHSLESSSRLVTQALINSPRQAFINLEPWYEGILGNFGERQQRYAFWMSMIAGSAGHTYGADGLWNMRTEKDGFLAHWGQSSWEHALTQPGAAQLGRGSHWVRQHAWWEWQQTSSILTSSWSENQAQYPLGCKMSDSQFLLYFPELKHLAKCRWTERGAWHGKWLDPKTMSVVEHFELRVTHDSESIPCQTLGEDGLLVMSAK